MHARSGFAVKRYHTVNVLVEETVGHHSANVAMLLAYILPKKDLTVDLLLAALEHDLAEVHTGDVPAPAKWAYPQLKQALSDIEESVMEARELTPLGSRALKQADMLDLCFKCLEEIRMGNSTMMTLLNRGLTFLEGHDPLPATAALMMEIRNELSE